MCAVERSEIKRNLSEKTSEELIQIWTMNNRDEYSTMGFEVIKEILTERGATLPAQNPYHPPGKYRKVRLPALNKRAYGVYRGTGSLLLEDGGIRVKGKHVYSLGVRWGIGIAIAVISVVITGGALMLGIIPIYLLVEYVFLKKEEITVPWDKIQNFGVDPRRKLVGVTFDGPPATSPIMYVSDEWNDIALKLRERIPGKEKEVTPPKVFLCECEDRQKADQVFKTLQGAGIDCWVEQPDVSKSTDIHRPRIMVANQQLRQAEKILSPDDFKAPVCPKCGANDPVLEAVEPENLWRCESCGAKWT